MRQLIERGLMGAAVIAGALAGFAGFLFLMHRMIKCMRPKEVRQAEIEKIKNVFLAILRDIKKDMDSGEQSGEA